MRHIHGSSGAHVEALGTDVIEVTDGRLVVVQRLAFRQQLPEPAQVDFLDAPLTFYGQQWGAAAVSDNGYIVFGESFYPYEPTTFGNETAGAPKVAS
jgi:hypothetical protein